MAGVITVGAIDDHHVVLQGMAAWLGAVPDIQLTVTATGVDAYLAAGISAQVVLLDLNLPDHSDPAGNVKRLTGDGGPSGKRSLTISCQTRIGWG